MMMNARPQQEARQLCVLDEVRDFAASVLYASDQMLDALVLAVAVTHTVDSFSTVPRLLFTSPMMESGKSTALDVIMMTANNGWEADATSYALRAKFNEPERPTLVLDEISDIFGLSGLRGRNNPLGAILRRGYRSSFKLSLSVDRAAVEVSAFVVAAMAGLSTAVPADIRSRSIVFNMTPPPAGCAGLADSQDSDTIARGAVYRSMLHQWARGNADEIRAAFRSLRSPHPKFRGRRAQIWGPLYAVALTAGCGWPERCVSAFRSLALEAGDQPVLSPPQMVLRDVAAMFAASGADRMLAADLASGLRDITDTELYQALTERSLARLMTEALGTSTTLRSGSRIGKGWYAAGVSAAWSQLEALLTQDEQGDAEDDEYDTLLDVEDVTV